LYAGSITFYFFYSFVVREATASTSAGISVRFRTDGKLFNFSRLRASFKVQLELVQKLLYADDCVFFASSEADLQIISSSFANAAKKFGLKINVSKTEVLVQPIPGQSTHAVNIVVDNIPVKQVNKFTYFGSVLNEEATVDDDVHTRIQKAAASFGRLQQPLWKKRGISTDVKVKVCCSNNTSLCWRVLDGVSSPH